MMTRLESTTSLPFPGMDLIVLFIHANVSSELTQYFDSENHSNRSQFHAHKIQIVTKNSMTFAERPIALTPRQIFLLSFFFFFFASMKAVPVQDGK